MNRIAINMLLSLLILASPLARAGFGQSRAQIEREVERLERKLAAVSEIVRSFDNKNAQNLVNKARAALEKTKAALQRNQTSLALGTFKQAESLLDQALKLTLDGPIRRLRSRLEELLRVADGLVARNHRKEGDRLLQQAKNNRNTAERALAANQINRSVEHYRVAIALAEQVVQMLQRNDLTADRFVDEKRDFENRRERAREIIEKSHNARAKQIFDQAIRIAFQAEAALRNKNIEAARKFYNQAMLLLLRAIDLASGQDSISPRQLRAALNTAKRNLAEARSSLIVGNRPRGKVLFERARRFLAEAELAITQGKAYQAMWKIELAENILKRSTAAQTPRQNRQFPSKLDAEIESAKAEIARARTDLPATGAPNAGVLLRMAEFTISRAEQASAAGMHRFALEAVLASQKFLTKAERILNRQDSVNPSKNRVQVRFDQLDAAMRESEGVVMSAGREWNRQLLRSAKEIRAMSWQSFQEGNYQAANEGIQISFELIRKSQKNIPRN